MKKKKKNVGLYYLVGLILIIALSAIISNTLPKAEEVEFNNVSYTEYKELLNSSELEFIYVGHESCGYCQMTVPVLGELQEEYSITFNYLDTDTMTSDDYVDISNTAEVFAGEWGTPTLLAIKDGTVLGTVSGFDEAKIRSLVSTEMGYPVEEVEFNNVSYTEYKELLSSSELEFIYVGHDSCGYCQMTVPLLGELQEEYSITFNYLDTDIMTSEDFTDISSTAEVFAGEWGTPTLLAVKDKKVISTVSGYREIEYLKEFVEEAQNTEAN